MTITIPLNAFAVLVVFTLACLLTVIRLWFLLRKSRKTHETSINASLTMFFECEKLKKQLETEKFNKEAFKSYCTETQLYVRHLESLLEMNKIDYKLIDSVHECLSKEYHNDDILIPNPPTQ